MTNDKWRMVRDEGYELQIANCELRGLPFGIEMQEIGRVSLCVRP